MNRLRSPTDTPVAQSVQLGTGLSGSGQTVSIVDPKTSFTSHDTFAFVIHLRVPIDATQMSVLIYDSNGKFAADWDWSVQQTDTILSSVSPSPLGALFQSFHNSNQPSGSYKLVVFPSPTSFDNYANDVTFTYTP